MLKRSIAILLALCALGCCLLPAAAQQPTGTIRVHLRSDVAGLNEDDTDMLLTLSTDTVYCSSVLIADYAGTQESGALVAGRTYTAYYSFKAADGYELPEALTEGDVEITCDKGVTVYAVQRTVSAVRNENGEMRDDPSVRIYAEIVVDGNPAQRIFGWIYDLILKIKAWSLY
ncbi:MAG: hypothetical protein IK080_08230 [Clostridia bacterium]|nr:hypothetical protein [Clostridia bacterium]